MTKKPIAAGDPIESRCTKCRTMTNHTIIAMDASGPAKVECNTCGGQHKYRPAAAAKAPAKKGTGARRPRVDPKELERQLWQELEPKLLEAKTRAYDMAGTFRQADVLDHPAFGLGLVEEARGDRKMIVLFADGRKVLRTG